MTKSEFLKQPPHMEWDHAWELGKGQPNPTLLNSYLRWLMQDEERFDSAVESMQWLPPGFNMLLIARKPGDDNETLESVQLNFYHPDSPGNEEPHGHARNAVASWYSPPGTKQLISRYMVLHADAPNLELDGVDVEEHQVVANNVIDLKDGRRPIYKVLPLGGRLILKQSQTEVAPLGRQFFASTEVHHVGLNADEQDEVAVSVHYKGPEEPVQLSQPDGLVYYKGISMDDAVAIGEARRNLTGGTELPSNARLAPTTMMYRPMSAESGIEETPKSTSGATAEKLLVGAIRTTERLQKSLTV